MATTANYPSGAMPVHEMRDGEPDPFVSTPNDAQRQRLSAAPNGDASFLSSGSTIQARKHLEAHLAETDRRLKEASKLGTVLVEQRKELAEKLKELQTAQDDGDISPELRQRLSEVERDFHEVGRETARVFVAKNRVPSNEHADSPGQAVFSSDASHSPSKLHAPSSRKQRLQPSVRGNDLKLATDIGASLLVQVKDLQAAYAENQEAHKLATSHKAQLEVEVEGLHLRLKAMDDSEQRYKDENWSLETQVRDLQALAKESARREQKLSQSLKVEKTQKADLERDFEELKLNHGKLSEDHTTAKKYHESELLNLRRDVTSVESERSSMQRKIDELTSQNQDLAKAMTYRLNRVDDNEDRDVPLDMEDTREGATTPEHSPPPSPIKGTPRHGHLESETLKSSLQHAHRMIQNLRNNIHREKTEKLELRRMLQDAREELESKKRDGSNAANSAKKRKSQPELFKKPMKPDRLGASRNSNAEIIMDDEGWEDHDGRGTPSRQRAAKATIEQPAEIPGAYIDTTENESGFETARERATATESEAFQTGVESIGPDSSDEVTETEGNTGTAKRSKVSPLLVSKNRISYQSTASTSGDDDFDEDVTRTPIQAQQPKYKLKMSRSGYRRSTQSSFGTFESNPDSFRDSPASVGSNASPPAPPGQSLFSELGNLSDDSDGDSYADGTPSKSVIASREGSPVATRQSSVLRSPQPLRAIPLKPVMVDSGMMTEPWEPESKGILSTASDAVGAALAGGIGFGLGRGSKDDQLEATEAEAGAESNKTADALEMSTVPSVSVNSGLPQISEAVAATEEQHPEPPVAEPVVLSMSSITMQETEPIELPEAIVPTPTLQPSLIMSQNVEPVEPVKQILPPPATVPWSFASVMAQYTEPKAAVSTTDVSEPFVPVAESVPSPPLAMSSISSQSVEPMRDEPERPRTAIMVDQANSPIVTRTNEVQPPLPTAAVSKSGAGLFGNAFGRKSGATAQPFIAEDETSQPLSKSRDLDVNDVENMERPKSTKSEASGRAPFSPIIANGTARSSSPKKDSNVLTSVQRANITADEGTQTLVSADEFDAFLEAKKGGKIQTSPPKAAAVPVAAAVAAAVVSPKKRDTVETGSLKGGRRPGSAGSVRSRAASPPPLPADHKQAIAAASQGRPPAVSVTPSGAPSPGSFPTQQGPPPQIALPNLPTTPGSMGPPMMPASAYRQPSRPRTPLGNPQQTQGNRGGLLARAPSSIRAAAPRSEVSSPITRRSSVSSFASELDQRFNIARSAYDNAFDPNTTDPRMIQAITQTMIGEFLWKYTRKAGRGGMSENRHRRFFWVHPYTRTLYWSDHDPSSAGSSQLKAKSVAIEAVRVVTDDNVSPPGLHRKSLVVITPGRTIKFTAPTSQRHETWFNALSYLLLRTSAEKDEENSLTAEDVDEFNPSNYNGGRTTRMSQRSKISLSTYNSRHTNRTLSPSRHDPHNVPTLGRKTSLATSAAASVRSTATSHNTPSQKHGSISGRFSSLSGVFKSGGTIRESFSSRQSFRNADPSGAASTYSESAAAGIPVGQEHDSAEDLRAVIERQEREADRLENVRACCDGKHDVGSLTRKGGPGHTHGNRYSLNAHSHSHRHAEPSGSHLRSQSVGNTHREP
ncbi:hypothetical protein K402DRAFT_403268 [Aulographum hederae CBS 113979]|uniref:PH domain-containing protein n=1 Tax=Aulographum hederae CBS 113979 TaxID=1176131 RepID=A0A6G1H4W9_9PEZI|nr:hypothetical protein K402DRAFT_403268 [Aulographum hederae CBS 113979]